MLSVLLYNSIKSKFKDYVESYFHSLEIGHKQKKLIGSRTSHLEKITILWIWYIHEYTHFEFYLADGLSLLNLGYIDVHNSQLITRRNVGIL